jgi:alpha-mannosidase
VAQFEVCAQRWVDLSEHGFGVSLLNDCKHGHSVTGSELSLSLLRAPKTPDPTADMGRHVFTYALRPHSGSALDAETTKAAAEYNTPLLTAASGRVGGSSAGGVPAIFTADETAGVILDTIKLAEDGAGVVLRLFEAHGGRATGVVRTAALFGSAHRCDILEQPLLTPGAAESLVAEADHSGGGITLWVTLRPFEVCTILLRSTRDGSIRTSASKL